MEARIQQELDGRKPDEVPELILDNCKCTGVEGLSGFTNLEYLSINNCDLTNLKGFPELPSLKRLEMMDNKLSGGLGTLKGCPSMTHLNLSGNKIEDLASLEELKSLSHLKSLDLFNCSITAQDDFREKVFEQLSQLQYLDGFDREGAEAEDSDDELNGDVEDDEDDEEGDEDDEVGLDYLASAQVEDEDETEDFIPGEDPPGDEEDDIDEDEDGAEPEKGAEGETNGEARGTKRKLEEETKPEGGDAAE